MFDDAEWRPRSWRQARKVPDDALETIAAQPMIGEGRHDGRISNARGELAERRVVRLLKAMCEVAMARQTSREEDAALTADVVAVLRSGERVLLQVKSGALNGGSAKSSVRRAKAKGVKVVLARPTTSEAELASHLRTALGLEVDGFLGSPVKIKHGVGRGWTCGRDLRQCGQKVFDFPNRL